MMMPTDDRDAAVQCQFSNLALVGTTVENTVGRGLTGFECILTVEESRFAPLPTDMSVPATNATAKDGDYSSDSRTRLEEPPPGIRTASMANLGIGAIGGGVRGSWYRQL